ncbi:MAG: branched-chain amino acid ABC transporter permease [Alphaproteobacteria bacterium]|nr:MAG: branched-chain amino acid ABC transporter permease [Alphaproteobacteria bacterium]
MSISRRIIAVTAFLILVFAVIPILIAVSGRKDFYYTLSSVALLSMASAGVWLTFHIGRINIGQGAYALMGGYVSAILVMSYGVSFWWTLPLAGLFCPAELVRQGIAMVTLVLTEVARLLALALPVTQGAKGITSIPLPGAVEVFGLTLVPDFTMMENPRIAFYYLSVALMTACFALMHRLVNSRIGHICMSLQQNEELASSIGINIAQIRVIAYAISSFLGGLAGAVFVAATQSVYPSSFTVADSINFMLNCFLGGLGYVFGPMLGTLVLYFGWNLLFETGRFQLLIYSALMIALMLVLPNGLLSLGTLRKER